jgi:hypothetical protein
MCCDIRLNPRSSDKITFVVGVLAAITQFDLCIFSLVENGYFGQSAHK